MKNYSFSPSTLAFYPEELMMAYTESGILPGDLVDVSDDIFLVYSGVPPEGKMRGADNDSQPVWIDIPTPPKEQLAAEAEAQKQYLIAEVQTETQMLQTKLSLKRIKPAELELLNAWLDYLDLLEAVDTSTSPDIDWPQKPQ